MFSSVPNLKAEAQITLAICKMTSFRYSQMPQSNQTKSHHFPSSDPESVDPSTLFSDASSSVIRCAPDRKLLPHIKSSAFFLSLRARSKFDLVHEIAARGINKWRRGGKTAGARGGLHTQAEWANQLSWAVTFFLLAAPLSRRPLKTVHSLFIVSFSVSREREPAR